MQSVHASSYVITALYLVNREGHDNGSVVTLADDSPRLDHCDIAGLAHAESYISSVQQQPCTYALIRLALKS